MTIPDDTAPRWMSSAEAASYLGITIRTLYRFIDQGELPAYRFGRVIRLKQQEVETFITASRIEPGELDHLYPDQVGRIDETTGPDETGPAGPTIDVTVEDRTPS
ncbi:MAG TPA: helix-turn-helix domain-containing protein [Acidimicrobiales bacterium]|nr:helix-turn-helix domain-containing protein [Acidimicrobiales bacterium]